VGQPAWAGGKDLAIVPTAAHGFVLLMAAIAYTPLQTAIIAHNGGDSQLAQALGSDWKGKVSLACYVVSIPVAFIVPVVSAIMYFVVAMIWFVPDARIERVASLEER